MDSDDERNHNDNASNAGSSDNEQDDHMDDHDQENEDESDHNSDDDDDVDGDADPDGDDQNEGDEEGDGDGDGDDSQHPPGPHRSRSSSKEPKDVRPRPKLREGAGTASTYDIVPYVAAPQSTSINAFCATPCMRWIFTGGSDGYIRRFDWFGSINGRVPLTVAQRHPFVDSVTRAGILLSYWENEEPVVKSEHLYIPETTDDLKLSPVYSLAVQNQSLWLLSGLESGGINLQSVRHDEGKIITTLRKHTSAVSVLTLSSDERSLLSGSWDRNVYDWDLNTGQATRDFLSSAGQVSSIAFRPNSDNWQEIKKDSLINGASGGRRGDGGLPNGLNGASKDDGDEDAPGSPAESTRSYGSLFGDDDDDMGMGGGEVDEMSQAIASGSGLNGDTKLSQNGSGSQKGDDDGDITMGDSGSGGTKNGGGFNGTNGMHHHDVSSTNHIPTAASSSASTTDQNVFLVSSMDGTFRIWDRRQLTPVATSTPSKGVPPWCMDACWSTDGNFVYVGRRNGTVEEFNVHKGVGEPVRTMRFPMGSGPVSALAAMPNGRHLICASFDNLRLYDLSDQGTKSTVPFLIIPGHHGGVISSIYVDTTCQYMISTAGNRGWEGASTEVLLGYEIIIQP